MSDSAAAQPQYMIVDPGTFSTGARPDGTFGAMWTVTIRHPDNTESSFVVNDENYNATTVAAMAQDQAARRAGVAALGTG